MICARVDRKTTSAGASRGLRWWAGILPILILSLVLAGCASGDRIAQDRLIGGMGAAPAGESTGLPAASPATVQPPTTTSIPSRTPLPAATSTITPSPTLQTTPTQTPTATPLACWSQAGRFEYGSLRSDQLKLPMEYSVYLPPCYDQQPERRYPVLYMIHGMNYNNDQWDRLGADEAADALVRAGEVNPFIIVMPRDRSWEQPEDD
ncbi:MAG: alpha/beta hydrolase, partial [Anaerolineales bacterium]